MTIIFKKASIAHAVSLEVLARATFSETFGDLYSAENLAYHLNNTCSSEFFENELSGDSRIDIACEGNDLVGYIKYGAVGLPIAHTAKDVELHRLYVLKTHQTSGLGKSLMEIALQDERISFAPNIYLGVWEGNTKAQAFYARYGFVPIGEYAYRVGTQTDREIIMHRLQSVEG